MKDETKLFYDLTAEKTAEEWYGNPVLMPTIKDFLSLLPAGPRVLDMGSGTGHESMRLSSEGAEVVGIDFSPECVRIARERCPQCRFEVLDFRELDGRFGSFDGIFACASLIHIAPDGLSEVIGKAADNLKSGGCFLMIVQDGEGIDEKWSDLEVGGRRVRRPLYRYSKERLTVSALPAGLRFLREGFLDEGLLDRNWRNYVFKR